MILTFQEVQKVQKESKSKYSKSRRAQLQCPVVRVARYMRKGNYAKRIATNAAVYLTAVMEYMASELLELAGNASKDMQKRLLLLGIFDWLFLLMKSFLDSLAIALLLEVEYSRISIVNCFLRLGLIEKCNRCRMRPPE